MVARYPEKAPSSKTAGFRSSAVANCDLKAGVIISDFNFADIMRLEWRRTSGHGLVHGLRHLSAGAATEAMTNAAFEWAKYLLQDFYTDLRGKLKELDVSKTKKKRLKRQLKHVKYLYVLSQGVMP